MNWPLVLGCAVVTVLFVAAVVWRASQDHPGDDGPVAADTTGDTVGSRRRVGPSGTAADGDGPALPTGFETPPAVSVPPGGFTAAQLAETYGDHVWRVEVEGCEASGHGSGFPVGPHHVVTNWHVVVVDPSPTLVNRAGEVRQGRVVGMSADPDIALVAVDEPFPSWFGWADPAAMTEGQPLVAMGYPVPAGDFTVTNLSVASFETDEAGARVGIRVDGAVDYGNSGGPSLTTDGEVAGVNTSVNINVGGSAGGVFGGGTQVVPYLQSPLAVRETLDGFVREPTTIEADCGAVDPRAATTYGDNMVLDSLWDACDIGDGYACDELYKRARAGTEYEQFARTCGGRFGDGSGYCAQRFGYFGIGGDGASDAGSGASG